MYSRQIFLFIIFLAIANTSHGELIHSPEDVLKEQFGSDIEFSHKNHLLTKDKKTQIEQLAQTKLESNLFSAYTVQKKQQQIGLCYLDTQKVRTKNALIMVCIDNAGTLKRVEVIAFFEPKQYIPNKDWLKQFSDKPASDSSPAEKNVTALTGATLSAQAINKSVNIAKAIWKLNSSTISGENKK